jgi:CBS domain-containing protein
MTAGDLCIRQVVVAARTESIRAAARRIRDFHVGALVVVDDRAGQRVPVGMLTDRDLVVGALASERVDLDTLEVEEVMTPGPVTAHEADNLFDVVKVMRSFGVRRLPVVNDNGGLEGILTFDDLIDLLAEGLSDLTTLMDREQRREREVRA